MTTRKSKTNNRFLLLYASQTGQAKAIAEEIADTAPQYGLKADLFCLSLTDKRFSIEKEKCVVFVVSTTGDGEPPDTATKFIRRLNRHTVKPNYLEKLNYALLALGDSNYIKFCLFGRQLEKRLKALSSKSFYPTGYGDDAFGIETAVDPWVQNLWPALNKQLGLKPLAVDNSYGLSYDIMSSINEAFTLHVEKKQDNFMEPPSDKKGNSSIYSLASILEKFDVEKCRVPKMPLPILSITYGEAPLEHKEIFVPAANNLVSQSSPLCKATLVAARKLTFGQNVKNALELKFKYEDQNMTYEPGDSFGFICPNSLEEVNILLNRLNLLQQSDAPVSFQIHESSTSKRKLPSHFSVKLSLRDIFLHCVEIRSVPKKILLRVLAEYTKDEKEKQCLLFLSSREGSEFYADHVRKSSLNVLDILLHFKSCMPPVERTLEYLPALKPRFYSVASSPLQDDRHFKIVFNVLKFEKGEGRATSREGLCTGWMNSLSSAILEDHESSLASVTNGISALTLNCTQTEVFIYKRQNQHFKFGNNLSCPVIMVGPGTGVAPFIGYLQHREKLMENIEVDTKIGEIWLFYGCRFKHQDFLFKDELQRLKSCGVITHLVVSFSREVYTLPNDMPRYVHENIKKHADGITAAISAGGKIYVCGDAKHMAHDVQQAFIEALQTSMGLTQRDATAFVEKLQKEHKYVNDVWT